MAAIGDCCNVCPPVTPPVNIPGSPGEPGIPGSNGVNAFSTIASFQGVGFVVPAVNSSATVYLTDTGEWMALNQPVFISGAGQYQVTATASVGANGTSVQLRNLGLPGNAVPGSVVSAGNTISPSGNQGNNAYSVTTAQFSWGLYGTSSTITCTGIDNSVAWMQPGQVVYVAGAGYFQVNGTPNATNGTASLTLLQYAGNSQSGSVSSGAGVSPGGVQGSAPLPAPVNAYSNSLNVALTGSATAISAASITLSGAGTWLILARIVIKPFVENAASGPPGIEASLSSSSAGAIPDSATTVTFGSPGSSNLAAGYSLTIPPTLYSTANAADVISLLAAYSAAGTNTMYVGEVAVVAICLNLTT
jgi:hypothetical protein